MSNNLFSGETPAPAVVAPVVPQTPENPFATQLSGIQNEFGQPKYSDVPKALEGLAHAQQYIPQLKTELQAKEQELATLRAELASKATLEETISRLTAQQVPAPQGQGQPSVPSGLDEQAVLQLVQQQLNQTKAVEQASSNQAQVQQALASRFGEKSREVVESKAKELGTTPQELGKLASQNPAMVLALFNVTNSGPRPTTTSSSIQSAYQPTLPVLERPTKSLLSGATSKEQAAFMAKVKADVYAKHGVVQ
jgi:hypothetical protein